MTPYKILKCKVHSRVAAYRSPVTSPQTFLQDADIKLNPEYLGAHVLPFSRQVLLHHFSVRGPFLLLRGQLFFKALCLPLQFTPQLLTLDQSLRSRTEYMGAQGLERQGGNETIKLYFYLKHRKHTIKSIRQLFYCLRVPLTDITVFKSYIYSHI